MSNLFKGQSEITNQIKDKMNVVMNNMPGGQIPENISLSKLKGIAPNLKSIKSALSPDTGVPERYLAEFNPLNDLVKNIPIPTPELKTIDFTPLESKVEAEIDEAKLIEEGVPKKKIAELKRKREARQKANEVKTEISNKLQSSVTSKVNNIIGGVQNMAQSTISGAVTQAIGGINSPIIQKIAAYKYFKAQLGTVDERMAGVKEQIDKIKEEAKEVLKKQTESIGQKDKIEKEEKKQETETKQVESTADTFKSKPRSGGSEAGSKHNSKTTRKAKELREKVEGFKANAEQTLKNVGKLLTDVLGSLGSLLSIILKVVGALLSVIAFIMFLKQLMELLMLLLFKKSSNINNENSSANSPEDFLNEIGYPG